jgi:hypothetical protein
MMPLILLMIATLTSPTSYFEKIIKIKTGGPYSSRRKCRLLSNVQSTHEVGEATRTMRLILENLFYLDCFWNEIAFRKEYFEPPG